MKEIVIANENWEQFHINRVLKFIKSKATRLSQMNPIGTRIIRKEGKNLVIYCTNNRRIGPKVYLMEEVESEIAISILLEKV